MIANKLKNVFSSPVDFFLDSSGMNESLICLVIYNEYCYFTRRSSGMVSGYIFCLIHFTSLLVIIYCIVLCPSGLSGYRSDFVMIL